MARILLVEDEVIIALGATMALEDEGHEVVLATDGRAGLESAVAQEPDLVVTDYMMPRMNGLEMSAALRREGYQAPILLITASPLENLPGELIGHVNDCRQKPLSEGELVAAVELLIGKAADN